MICEKCGDFKLDTKIRKFSINYKLLCDKCHNEVAKDVNNTKSTNE